MATTSKVKPVPEGYPTVCPYIVVPGVAKLIDFAKQVFDATEGHVSRRDDGTVMHAEVKIGNSVVMMGEAPGGGKNFPAMLHLYMDDVDTRYKRAIQAGARPIREPADQIYGDRSAGVEDMCGNQWWIATHIEDVSPEEMERRAKLARG